MRDADAALPPERRRVLDGEALKLAEQGRMYNAAGQQLDIKSDRQKGKDGGYTFDPDALTLPLKDLKARYDPQTWAEFEEKAKKTTLPDGRDVWSWLNGEKAKKASPKTEKAAPKATKSAAAPAPASPPSSAALVADGTPLAGKLDVANLSKAQGKRVNDVLSAIDSVHGDGPLAMLPVGHKPSKGAFGSFRYRINGPAVRIDYRKRSGSYAHPELTLSHEIGHWVDYSGLPGGNQYASEMPGGPLDDVMKALRGTESIKTIEAMPDSPARSYYLKPREMWARAYSQFIAEESGHATMIDQLSQIRTQEPWPERQWDSADFAPVRAAIRNALKEQGWMKAATAP